MADTITTADAPGPLLRFDVERNVEENDPMAIKEACPVENYDIVASAREQRKCLGVEHTGPWKRFLTYYMGHSKDTGRPTLPAHVAGDVHLEHLEPVLRTYVRTAYSAMRLKFGFYKTVLQKDAKAFVAAQKDNDDVLNIFAALVAEAEFVGVRERTTFNYTKIISDEQSRRMRELYNMMAELLLDQQPEVSSWRESSLIRVCR